MRTVPAAIGLPGCKSTSQRALVLAAQTAQESRVQGLSDCRDSLELLAALQHFGVKARWEGRPGDANSFLYLRGGAPQQWLPDAEAVAHGVPAGEGASTLRFLAALLAAGRARARLRPSPQSAARPHEELFAALRGLGAEIEAGEDGSGPWLEVRGCGGFGARRVELGELRSSQTLSALWMAAGDAPITWSLAAPPGSRGYLDLTADMLRAVRGTDALTEVEDGRVWEQAPGYGESARFRVMADPSAVVFFAVAAILLRRSVRVSRPWTSRHADAALLRRLRAEDWLTWLPGDAGVDLLPGPSARRRELVVDLDAAPDCGPALAVLAAHLPAGARFGGLARLRIKESDRVAAMTRLAQACGALVETTDHELLVRPGPESTRPGRPRPACATLLETRHDHRTAMAAGIASLLHPGLAPDDPDCVAKSFPHFWEGLECLRG